MEDITDFEILDSENVADFIPDEIQSSNAKTSISCDTADLQESEMYHGVMVKPLSSFGEFEIDPESQEWQWICDRTSGEVHKDMKTVSKLYNQDLNLPSAALEFIMQSPKLQEEAKWEELKAVLYGFYPKSKQSKAFAVLAKESILEASRFICKKTSNFAHEAILKPINDIACNDDTAVSLNREIETMRGVAKSAIQSAGEALAIARKELDCYNTYTLDRSLSIGKTGTSHSPLWKTAIENLQLHKKRYIEARVFAFQLEHAAVRYEKRTQWIHIRTSPVLPSGEVDSLFAQLDRLSQRDDRFFRITSEEIQKAYSRQTEVFKAGLRFFGTGPFRGFDSLHSSKRFQAYNFLVPYHSSSPQMCTTLFRDLFEKPPPDCSYFFACTPCISEFPKSHHKIRVYIDIRATGNPKEKYGSLFLIREGYEKTLRYMESSHVRYS
ncbi:hypothetical protein OXX69_002057 [Metschnikowia pulcherrima]